MKKRFLFFILFALQSISSIAQNNFYNRNTIQKVELFFSFTNWDYRLDTASAGIDSFLIADSAFVNGIKFDSVGVKYKGNSSNNASNKKNPFHVELDHVKGNQDYQGYTDLKLNNGATDPSLVREVLAYYQLSNYMDAPKANYATVYVNNVWRGIYTNVESINNKFVGEHYFSNQNAFIKCNAKSPNTATLPNLVASGWDSILYYPTRYELKSDYGWTEFIQFQQNLNSNPTIMKTTLDIDRTLWMHAFNHTLVNLDSYTGNFAQNYYMYKDQNNLWIPTVWDLNMCYGSYTNLGAGNNLNITGLQNMDINTQVTNVARPLISKIVSTPTYKKMYVAHCKTILKETILNNDYYLVAKDAQNLIKDSIAVDSLLFFTYQKFIDNLDTSVLTVGVNQKIGIKQLLNGRNSYLNTTPEFLAIAPTISAIVSNPIFPGLGNTVTITATISNADSVFLGYRGIQSSSFTRLEMFDDGTHGDGLANDNIYGASFIVNTGKTDYYIYAQNANAGMFSPERAEHEFHTLLTNIPVVANDKLVLNELMASNTVVIADLNGEYDDWIELNNKSTTPINLTGLYLSDDFTNLSKWAFPANATIPANSFLLVWADQDNFQQGLHCNFKLSSGGEQLFLSSANGTIIDSVTYGMLSQNSAWGRCVSGTGPFGAVLLATPNVTNQCSVGLVDIHLQKLRIYPNPANQLLHIQNDSNINFIQLSTLSGSVLFTKLNAGIGIQTLSLANYPTGIYLLNINGIHYKINVQK